MQKIAVITGASSGIGLSCGEIFLKNGWAVYNLSRHAGPNDSFIHIETDVSDDASVISAFDQIARDCEGGIDLLLNNAGYGISGAVEFTDTRDAENMFSVNFFGAFRCIRAAVPLLRKKRGRIVNISSVAALFSIPFQAFYSAGKSATNSLTLALDNELRAFGIRVVAVMPGDVATGFTSARLKSEAGEDVYSGAIAKSVSVMEKDEKFGMSPDRIAAAVYRAATQKNPKPIRTVGFKYKLFAFLFHILPTSFANFIVGKLYVK